MILELVIILTIAVLLQGFFEGSEMAMVSADKLKLALACDSGSKRALMALHLIKRPARFFATTLVGSNLASIGGATFASLFIIHNYGERYAALTLLLWPITLVFAQIVPKSIYQRHADKMAMAVAPALFFFSFLLYPLVFLVSKLTDSLLGKVKKQSSQCAISREDLELMIEIGEVGTSDVKQSEKTLVSRVFDLADKKVENIMTPLVDVVAVPVTYGIKDAERVFDEHVFSRVPVYEESVFNVVGILVSMDIMFAPDGAEIKNLIRPAYFVPEEMPLDELLVAMKRKGESIAIAVDEYGAATGIVTVEDLLEEVVGEIRDEHDSVPANFARVGRHKFIVSGRMEIEEANDKLKLGIESGDYETVAGFVINRLEKIPAVGESFVYNQYEYKVMKSSERAVLEVEISRKV